MCVSWCLLRIESMVLELRIFSILRKHTGDFQLRFSHLFTQIESKISKIFFFLLSAVQRAFLACLKFHYNPVSFPFETT